MNVIEVIPISRGIQTDTLSYFTSIDVQVGAIVDVPLRSKTIQGMVINVQKAEDIKAAIKEAPFAFKKVENLKSKQFLSPAFMKAVRKTADFHSASIGSVLDVLVPAELLLSLNRIGKAETTTNVSHSPHEVFAIQGNDDDRWTTYRSRIREEFAKKSSVFVIVPTVEDARRLYATLEKGIEGYIFLLTSGLSKKKLIDTWNTIMITEHPVVVVCTGPFLCLPRHDIGTIILEKENNKSYKIARRPYIDMRYFAEAFAKEAEVPLMLGDMLLRVETLYRESEAEIVAGAPFKFRSLSTASAKLIDMRAEKSAKGNFKILSDEVIELIKSTKEANEHMVILASRRGLAPSVVCGDCQNIVTCNQCSSPVVLHKTPVYAGGNEENFLMCHRCGERRSADETCKHCASWKLGVVGIGIDLVDEKIRDKFPDITLFRIDSDTVDSDKKARAVVAEFKNHPGSILLGTEMALAYIDDTVENSVIISLDSLFAIPDFRIHEKIAYTVLKTRSLASRNFILQTRNADSVTLDQAIKGNLNEFFRSQIEERKTFNYPPFTTLIKFTLEGKKNEIVKQMEEVQNKLTGYEMEVFPAFTHTVRGNYVLHGLIRLPKASWVDRTLLADLRALPPSVIVKVDPDSLL